MSRECSCPKRNRWYFGGGSAVMASCITHPIDTVKVRLQTPQKKKSSIKSTMRIVIRESGLFGFFKGLSGAVVRQLTATQTRIAIYESGKHYLDTDAVINKLFLAAFAGAVGGVVGLPPIVVAIRMQNDTKLPLDKRRNYKNVFDGLWRIYKEEGYRGYFIGGSVSIIRVVVLTIGQNLVYDQAKSLILKLPNFDESIRTHLSASIVAAVCATVLTQPLDFIAVRAICAKPGKYKNLMDVTLKSAREGPLVFYKGFIPTLLRLGPHTILLFTFMEQLRLHFGYTVHHANCCPPEINKS